MAAAHFKLSHLFTNTRRKSQRRNHRYVKPLRNKRMRRASKDERTLIIKLCEMFAFMLRLLRIDMELKALGGMKAKSTWHDKYRAHIIALYAERTELRATLNEHKRNYNIYLKQRRKSKQEGKSRCGKYDTYPAGYSPEQVARMLGLDAKVVYAVIRQFVLTGHTDFEKNRKAPDSEWLRTLLPVVSTSRKEIQPCAGLPESIRRRQEEFRQTETGAFHDSRIGELTLEDVSRFLGVAAHSKKFPKESLLGDILNMNHPEYDFASITVDHFLLRIITSNKRQKVEKVNPRILRLTLRQLSWRIWTSPEKACADQERMLEKLPIDDDEDIYRRDHISECLPDNPEKTKSEHDSIQDHWASIVLEKYSDGKYILPDGYSNLSKMTRVQQALLFTQIFG